jgi:hypothetical protein
MKKKLSSAIWIIQTSSIPKLTLSKKFTRFYMRHIELYLNTIIDKGKIDAMIGLEFNFFATLNHI